MAMSAIESGEMCAVKIVAGIIGLSHELSMENNEDLCKSALVANEDLATISRHELSKNHVKKVEKKSIDIFAKMASVAPHQLKNQALRFGLTIPAEMASPRHSWGGFIKPFGHTTETRDYEDVVDISIIKAPICDVCIVQSNDPIPDGFYRLYKTPRNKKANLNSQSGGHPIYLCIKKDRSETAAPITNFIVFFPDRNEYVPPGYYIVQKGVHACNLNSGTSAERVYLCYKKDLAGNPITDIQIIFPHKGEETPKSFNRIEKSFSGVPANLNTGTNGHETFFCYRQQLTRLAVLLNETSSSSSVTGAQEHQLNPKTKASRRSSYNIKAAFSMGSTEDFQKMNIDSNKSSGGASATASHHDEFTSETDLFGQVMGGGTSHGGRHHSKSVCEPRLSDLGGDGDGDGTRVHRAFTNTSGLSAEESQESPIKSPSGGAGVDSDVKSTDSGDNMFDEGFEGQEDAFEAVTEDDATNSARKYKEVVDVTGKIAPVKSRLSLLAILAAVYVRQGSVATVAIDGLSRLMKDTNFFEHDLKGLPLPGTITMIDLCIETVCDRFDISCESEHDSLLKLIKVIIKYSGARLSPSSLQRMFRAISFLCNIHSTKNNWVIAGLPMPCNEPGDALTPFKVLKHLISDTVTQVELIEFSNFLPDTDATYFYDEDEDATRSTSYLEVRFVVEDLVESIIDSVEVSRLSEAALLVISKQRFTTTSGLFWQNVNTLSRRLFSDYQNRSAFVTLCAICKQAWMGIRTNQTGDPIPRDLGIKLIALEAITEFCLFAGDKMRNSKIMGYQIRRIVVPCILYNVNYALVDHKVFSKLLKIVTALWKKWRHCVRIEFAIICEQLVIKTLQASVTQIRPIFQMIVIQEVINWFDQPHLLVEMFVNYDMDRKFVSHWNIFSYLVRTICAIGRRLTLVTGAWDWRPGGMNSQSEESNRVTITIRDVHLQALEEVGRIAKTLMDASGHAYLIMQDEGFRNRSLGSAGGWIEDEDAGPSDRSSTNDSPMPPTMDSSPDRVSPPPMGRKRVGSVRQRRAAHLEAEELIKEAIKIYKAKDSLKKAVDYLIKQNFMADTPQEIANFLRVYKNSFDPSAIGDFLGEGGITPREIDYWSQIRFRYTRAVSFVEMDVEPALRLYLTGCGFRLPGEAQKIDRFVEVFVKAFWQDNGGTPNCPFKHQDTVHLVAYATIMLNTDLHRANTDKKKNQKMSKDQFINNLRGADQGNNIDRDYLTRIYDNIESHAIELDVSKAAVSPPPKKDEDKKIVGGDLVTNALATAAAGNKSVAADVRIAEEKKFIREVCRSLRDSEDLLRSLSPFTYRFQSGLMSLDLVCCMYETVWFHFHAIAESLLTANITDTYVKFAALDILCYSLTSAIFLDLKVERMTFATLLKTFRETVEKSPRVSSKSIQGEITSFSTAASDGPDNSWYEEVENANQYTSMDTIAKVHHLMVHIKDTIQETSTYELTRQVASRFEKKAKILENNIFFVRQGDLIKLNRSARPATYRFFLFSDYLIYAHLGKTEYKVHEQLSLNAMTISDVETDTNFTSFYISHPVKSFVVVAESPTAKQQWVRDINQTISSCIKREKSNNEGPINRRMSIYERIDHQQSTQKPSANAFGDSPERSRVPRHGSSSSHPVDTVLEEIFDQPDFQAVPFSNSNRNTPDVAKSPLIDPIPAAVLPTSEERALAQQKAVVSFSETVKYLTDVPLNSLFEAGITFWKGMKNTRGPSSLSDEQQLRLFGLFRQAKIADEAATSKAGPVTSTSADATLTPLQLAAWEKCRELSVDDAKREFLIILFSTAPYWKYEQFM